MGLKWDLAEHGADLSSRYKAGARDAIRRRAPAPDYRQVHG